ncbi:MAG: hypothetical protein OEW18_06700 [Candidatus Aminicenantes bacterium]|nr:hypothetical protein [Candidatus Aminicenantes bacterium]
MKRIAPFLIAALIFVLSSRGSAQFRDDFDGPSLRLDPAAKKGWTFFTGDGSAVMDFRQGEGFASILVDATKDQRNIWWALIKRDVSSALDLSPLAGPGYELRIEARIRVSHAPRRVNLHLNTQKTSDFHSHLMEFDIPDTVGWHTISMTTRDFEAEPGDIVNGQMALMDWGPGKYCVDVDYFKVDVVNVATAGPDQGVQVPYHPPIPDSGTFAHKVPVAQDSMIDRQYPEMNFNDWVAEEAGEPAVLLTVSGTQVVILRWDLGAFVGMKAAGSGLLELTTYSVERPAAEIKDFGQVRLVEILGGDPEWQQAEVTLTSLCQGKPLDDVLNGQMIIDSEISPIPSSRTLITVSQPVLQRLFDGKTLGLAIRPLGAIAASFYALENDGGKHAVRLLFNVKE